MKTFTVETTDGLETFAQGIEELIEKHELSQGDVFIFSMMYSVYASDQMEMDRDAYLMNCANFWDAHSDQSAEFHRKEMQ